MNLFIDIETICSQRLDVRAYIEASMLDELDAALNAVCAPANYKDADKIAAFCAERRASLQSDFADKVKQAIEKTGLDGAFGQICCIGWAINDKGVTTAYSPDDEAWVLHEFAAVLGQQVGPSDRHSTCVIGHNVSAFDLRFLTQRYIVNGIKPPMVIARAAQAKPWESEKVFDTMIQWAGVGGRITLDKLCLALSIDSPKGDMDGSKVWQAVQDGRIEEVARYCERDVEATRAVWKRMTFSTVPQFEDVPA